MKDKITISTVAEQANVSLGTVSRVLKNDPTVSKVLVARVLETIEALDYKPIRNTRSANPKNPLKNKNICILLVGMDNSLAHLPAVAEAIQGAETRISELGGSAILCNYAEAEKVPPALQSRIDGFIIKSTLVEDSLVTNSLYHYLNRFLNSSTPIVWLLNKPRGLSGDVAGADEYRVGELAVSFAAKRGFNKVAVLSPRANHTTFQQRISGFISEAVKRNVDFKLFLEEQHENLTLPLPCLQNIGEISMLFDNFVNVCDASKTALFLPADSIATLVYHYCASRNLKIGKDVHVISANNERTLVGTLYPVLTTIDSFSMQAGKAAANLLSDRIVGDSGELQFKKICIEPELVEGLSVGFINDN